MRYILLAVVLCCYLAHNVQGDYPTEKNDARSLLRFLVRNEMKKLKDRSLESSSSEEKGSMSSESVEERTLQYLHDNADGQEDSVEFDSNSVEKRTPHANAESQEDSVESDSNSVEKRTPHANAEGQEDSVEFDSNSVEKRTPHANAEGQQVGKAASIMLSVMKRYLEHLKAKRAEGNTTDMNSGSGELPEDSGSEDGNSAESVSEDSDSVNSVSEDSVSGSGDSAKSVNEDSVSGSGDSAKSVNEDDDSAGSGDEVKRQLLLLLKALRK